MTVPSLAALLIENLRGSVTPFRLGFERGKKLTIIYGENGTGKSTVCDAFDLLGNGNVGSLDTRGLGQTRRYWHSVGKKAADIKVTLETSSGDCIVALGKADVSVSNQALRPKVAVLRRSEILRLIEAKPADRYKEISRFVDVSGVEASEGTLRELIRNKSSEFSTASTRVSENTEQIERLWIEAGSPAPGAITWAAQEVQKDRSHLGQRKSAIDRMIALWDGLAAHPSKIAELATQLSSAEDSLQGAHAELAALTESVASDYLEVLDILKAAQAHFHRHPNPSVCPLCESSEKAAGLVEEVNKRMQSQGLYDKLEAAKKTVGSRETDAQQAKQRWEDAKSDAANAAAALENYCNSGQVPADMEIPAFPVPPDTAQWEAWRSGHQGKRDKWKSISDACVADERYVAALRGALTALQNNEKRAKDLEALIPRLMKTLELVENERRKFTDGILEAISNRVGVLYEAVHLGEGLNKIGLAMDAAKRASLEISTEFCGQQDAPPQAYFSDSHLDTLGLCVFLALAEREVPEEKILVLDDVLGSVDEPHVDRIVEMLYEETSKFRHCLITTHYGPWRHKFRWGWLKSGQCQFLELVRWSFSSGISHSRSIPETERLRQLLGESSPDHQAICAKSGVILEAVLDFLTQLYECSVSRRAGATYTLGDLLPAVDSKLKKALRVEHRQEDPSGTVNYIEKRLEPHLSELARIAQVRNVTGCHFNALSFALLDSDSIAFGKEVLTLIDALVDHDVGWPRNDRSGSYWATTGETRRLHPLKKPS
ncbi:hypothetical protein ACG33_02810 [Steroidobacter denitrificans]|uniref:Rad50/SbcC-type AAA domain-containing protein n=1 Tax=Steroidobacter denitrificans TaxID=465721 RepID=A0A127F6N9_STEDE|nr:AAA family ATPase [Steroidobacter denitrificans]AMN46057.1 hypothetical protein ACG33_02810 [Steroidobacter denitrificans]